MRPRRELSWLESRLISKLAQFAQEPHCIIGIRGASFHT
jgi:hypothetical protein